MHNKDVYCADIVFLALFLLQQPDSSSTGAHIPAADIYLYTDAAAHISNYTSTEMSLSPPHHVIIAQGNNLFHARGDAVHADYVVVHRVWTRVTENYRNPSDLTNDTLCHKF